MKQFVTLLAIIPLCGCANFMVPKTEISGQISGAPFSLTSPKDAKLNGLKITAWNMGAFSNHVSIEIQSVESKMNPEIVTMSGEVFVNSINASGENLLKAVSAAK